MAKAGSAKGRRLRERALARREAASQPVPASCDVCVVGGGASGLVAAMAAARRGASTVLLEAGPRVGATILATGNGRCNLSNTRLSPDRYNRPGFVSQVMGPAPEDAVGALFGGLGLVTAEEDGRLYPRSRVAASVRSVLVRGLAASGATVGTLRRVAAVTASADGFELEVEELFREDASERGGWAKRRLGASRLVWAAGGGSADAVAALGVGLVACSPVLCPVAVAGGLAGSLDGHRARCLATATRSGAPVARERGEVLFRDGALSGIVALDLSRFVAPGDTVALDLVPELDEAAVVALLGPAPLDPACADGLVDPAVARELLPRAQASPDPAAAAARLIKHLPFEVVGLAHPETAQVTRGGVACGAVDAQTLEARAAPGLHVCGEALDVDGACGGYNLAFAWLSGERAGGAAADSLRLPQKPAGPLNPL